MATIRRFEDIKAWQMARALSKEVFRVSSQGKFAKDFELRNQINRASGSVMDNIAEGFGRGGRNEFVNMLSISKASCDEVKSQLYRAFDREHLLQPEFDHLFQMAEETSMMINGLIEYLNKSTINGQKFKNRTQPTVNSKL